MAKKVSKELHATLTEQLAHVKTIGPDDPRYLEPKQVIRVTKGTLLMDSRVVCSAAEAKTVIAEFQNQYADKQYTIRKCPPLKKYLPKSKSEKKKALGQALKSIQCVTDFNDPDSPECDFLASPARIEVIEDGKTVEKQDCGTVTEAREVRARFRKKYPSESGAKLRLVLKRF
jgi:hypothetical protein